MLPRLMAIVGVLALTACVSPYERFYQPITVSQSAGFAPFDGEPRVIGSAGDAQRDVRSMYEDGYGLVGSSDFVAPAQGQAGAIAQAKRVGAAVVVVSSKFRNTVSGAMPLTLPTSTTSYSSGTVNAYGSSGFATGNYSGITTTSGTQTTYIPYSVDRYDQYALYFAPLQRKGFGALVNNMTDEQRRSTGTNQGMQVVTVRRGSPAFRADIIPGDIILTMDGKSIFDLTSARAALASVWGHDVEVVLVRGGSRIEKHVPVPADTW